jgi:acetate kinase
VTQAILALNPGSSSLKAALRAPELQASFLAERLDTDGAAVVIDHSGRTSQRPFRDGLGGALSAIAAQLQADGTTLAAVAHRVVHGGPHHYRPTLIDEALLGDLHDAIPLAPLHLPGDLVAIEQARQTWPDAQHVACFDTGFHHDLPARSVRLPVPAQLAEQGVRRYGFHGLSVQSVLHARPQLGGAVIAHLGSGCSVSAVSHGRPRHTTMSLTPTGGMVSATRTGDLDPEIVLYLIEQHGYSIEQLRRLFDHSSGLAGLAEDRHDVRDLLSAHDDDAALAIDVFATSAAMAIVGCATTLDQWDALVFTGGVGEHSDQVRELISRRLLVARGETIGEHSSAQAALTAAGLDVFSIEADEEGVLDRLTRELLYR